MAEFNGVVVDEKWTVLVDGGVQQNLIGTSRGEGCGNCGGSGVIVHTAIEAGPFKLPPATTGPRVAVYGHQGWFTGESKSAPCPVCAGQAQDGILVRASNVPVSARTKRLEFYETGMLKAACEKIIDSPIGMFTFFGGHGTGKTTASMIVVTRLCQNGVRAVYKTAQEIAMDMKETWGNPDRSEQDIMDNLMRVKFLVIDEVDRVTSRDEPGILNLVDARYRERDRMGTLLITNLDITRRENYLTSRMADGVRVPVFGKDMRHT